MSPRSGFKLPPALPPDRLGNVSAKNTAPSRQQELLEQALSGVTELTPQALAAMSTDPTLLDDQIRQYYVKVAELVFNRVVERQLPEELIEFLKVIQPAKARPVAVQEQQGERFSVNIFVGDKPVIQVDQGRTIDNE